MLSKQEYVALFEFRSQLARFLRFSESAARAAGVTPKQYLILLHIRGVEGRDWATVGELAVRLQLTPNGAVALINRCVASGLVSKRRNGKDARRVEVHITHRALKLVDRIAGCHRDELQTLRKVFRVAHVN